MPRNFSNWLKGYMDYTSASESPTAFHFWTGVSTIAGALRRQVWIDERYFQWTPNFYIVLVGPPGVAAKSTTIRAGMSLLEKLKIPFGSQSGTWQALVQSLEQSIFTRKYFDREGIEQKLIFSAITIPVSELGTFMRTDDAVMMDVLVDLWDGQPGNWAHKTKSSGNVEIQNPWVNIIACTTPSWLQNNFPEHMIGGGLTSRILFVFGDKKRQLVAYPSEVVNGPAHKETAEKLFLDLAEISTMAGEYFLTPEAREWGRIWYEAHWTNRPAHMASERYGGYIARKQTHIHKLAIVLAAAKSSKLVIEKTDLQEADQLITSIEADMQRVFSSIGLVDSARQTQEILTYVRNYGFITTTKLWQLCMASMDLRTFQSNIQGAVTAGQLQAVKRGNEAGLIIPGTKPE